MTKRRDLFDPTDPARLQPEQRLTEVAVILAAGMIRMRQKRRVVAAPNDRACPGRVHDTAIKTPRERTRAEDFTGIRRNLP